MLKGASTQYLFWCSGLGKAEWEKLIDSLVKQGILYSPKVVNAMLSVPRVKFLPEDIQPYGAVDTPLQIGFGQTVSAPHMVSIMNEALQLEVGQKVLEVGAGSGWHAATITELVAAKDVPRSEWGHVYTVEIVQVLAETARKNIMNAGYGDRITIINADGSKGYPEKAPYDRIVVTAAAPEVPQPLLDQLKANGVMVIPVGEISLFQTLMRLTKDEAGKIRQENLGEVAFVPLTGEYGHG
jgi:protein-L-isoaspartate(D-aspartate) O-methyltransferase